MKTGKMNIKLFSVKWWNPLFWLYVITAPFVWAILTVVVAVFTGAVIGYSEGLRKASRKIEKIEKNFREQ